MKNIFLHLAIVLLITACNSTPENIISEKSPQEAIAEEIGKTFHTDSLFFQIIEDQDYVRKIRKHNYRLSYYSKVNEKVNPDMTSMFAYLFYTKCTEKNLNGDIVTVKLATRIDSAEKSYFFNDFRSSKKCMKVIDNFLKAYQLKNYTEMRKYFDEGFSSTDIDNALQTYKKVDSLYGPITNSELAGLNFLVSDKNDSITEVSLNTFHKSTNTGTKHIYHVNRRSEKFNQLSVSLIGGN